MRLWAVSGFVQQKTHSLFMYIYSHSSSMWFFPPTRLLFHFYTHFSENDVWFSHTQTHADAHAVSFLLFFPCSCCYATWCSYYTSFFLYIYLLCFFCQAFWIKGSWNLQDKQCQHRGYKSAKESNTEQVNTISNKAEAETERRHKQRRMVINNKQKHMENEKQNILKHEK